MSVCPKCEAVNADGNKFCAHCGAGLEFSREATVDHVPLTDEGTPEIAAPSSHSSFPEHGRFEPGTRLGQRYRIVALLGRGGMGEVYRADDLELGQSVALKFLPERVINDREALQRFRGEVRTARQVAHPNVCRTYDIGEVDGHIFLSMEYIDGEDLAHVLKRMGRPSKEKAVEIARQLCLGLAAAHENGVLHRDLKPANVMIDGRGRVRITDFGLAGLIEELEAADELAGTPAYMAPEQLSSGAVSVRSDLYALGLIFYEIFTGGRVYRTNNVAELRQLHSSSSVTAPSSVVEELDPAVDRVIQRCLEHDPQRRPASVYAVLGALPGADPLTAALAAGETPSPDLVADAGNTEIVSPRFALIGLVASLLLLIVNVAIAPRFRIDHYVPLVESDNELIFMARELLDKLGYTDLPPYRANGFDVDKHLLEYVAENDQSPDRWDRLDSMSPPPVVFWYRMDREPVMGAGLHVTHVLGRDPPITASGGGIVELDPRGNLAYLAVTAAAANAGSDEEGDATEATPSSVNLDPVFTAAGLDQSQFVPCPSPQAPDIYCDELWSFVSPNAATDSKKLVFQVGSYQGRINWFDIVTPWIEEKGPNQPPAPIFVFALFITGTVILVAIRNLKLGRGDRRGAFRLAIFIVTTMILGWAIRGISASGTPPRLFGNLVFEKPLGHALQHALLAWLLYIALEPLARRYWPWTLVTWTRLLMGRFRDPQIGRDILVGGLLAGTLGIIEWLGSEAFVLAKVPLPTPKSFFLIKGLSLGAILEDTISYAHQAVMYPMGILVLLIIFRVPLRKNWAAPLAVLILLTLLPVFASISEAKGLAEATIVGFVSLFYVGAILYVVLQFGLLPVAVAQLITTLFSESAVTWDLSLWYAGPALVQVMVCVLLLVYGCYIALAGRPLFAAESD